MRRTSKAVVLSTLTGALLALAPAPVQAAKPPTIPLTPATYEFGAGTVCGFPITFEETSQGETVRLLPRAFHVTGAYKATVTNVTNGKTLSLNASGPTINNVSAGPWVYLLFPTDATGPGIYLFSGRTIATRDETNTITGFTYSGRRSADLCAAIA